MITCTAPQGSQEWANDRAGVITASMFAIVRAKVNGLNDQQKTYVDALQIGHSEKEAQALAGYKAAPRSTTIARALAGEEVGEYSEAAKNYAFRLAVERIYGASTEEAFETWQMRRGKELEEPCRIRHERDIGTYVELATFIKTDDNKFGCSADALIDEDGGAEYKCFLAPDKLRPIIIDNDWGDITDQVQGSLWLTGRKWWDQCLYCPPLANAGKDFTRLRVARDEKYIEELEADMTVFEQLVTEWEARLRA